MEIAEKSANDVAHARNRTMRFNRKDSREQRRLYDFTDSIRAADENAALPCDTMIMLLHEGERFKERSYLDGSFFGAFDFK